MADFEVKIEGLTELKRALRDYLKIAEPVLQKAVSASGAIFAKYTLRKNPVPYRTGNLLQSFRFQVSRLQARWFPTAHYAPFVQYGTQPHKISPRIASVLAWQSGGFLGRYVTAKSGRRYYKSGKAGTTAFAAYVNHPGTKPQPFMDQIRNRATPDINRLFVQALDQVNRIIAQQIKSF